MISDRTSNVPSDVEKKKKIETHKLKDINKLMDGQIEDSNPPTASSDIIIHEKEWDITSVNIYTTNGFPVFSANYTSDLSSFDSSIVMQFYQTVQSFAENNLKTSLIDFKVADERVFFKVDESRQRIYLITVKLGGRVRSGLNSAVNVLVSSLITDLSTLLFFYESEGDLEKNFSLHNAISEMIQDVNLQSLIEKSSQKGAELNVSYLLITDDTGIPILARTYGDDGMFSNEDEVLVPMFLHALNVFFNTNFADDLQEINFGNLRMYIRNYDHYFYALFVEFPDFTDLEENSKIHEISYEMLHQMNSLVMDVGIDILSDMSDDSLQLMVDNIIFKGLFKLNEELTSINQ